MLSGSYPPGASCPRWQLPACPCDAAGTLPAFPGSPRVPEPVGGRGKRCPLLQGTVGGSVPTSRPLLPLPPGVGRGPTVLSQGAPPGMHRGESGPALASWTHLGFLEPAFHQGVGCSPGAWPPLHYPGDPVHQPIRPLGPKGDEVLVDRGWFFGAPGLFSLQTPLPPWRPRWMAVLSE